MKKKAIAILVATTLLMTSVVSFAGCGTKKTDDAPAEVTSTFKGTKIYRTTNGKVKTLHPHLSQSGDEGDMQAYLFAAFTGKFLDENKEIKEYPVMAKELPTVSEDKLVYTYKLREGLKFADGTPIDADTYIYSFQKVLDPQIKAQRGDSYFKTIFIKGAKNYFTGNGKWEDVGIKAKDKYTLEFTLEKPASIKSAESTINIFAAHLVNPKLYEKCLSADKKTSTYGTSLETMKDGCYGPYIITEWNFDQYYKFEKNKDFPQADKYSADVYEARVVEQSSTILQLFEKNEVDFAGVTAAAFDKYKEDPRVKYGQSKMVFQMNANSESTTAPILKDVNMRKALFYAMDREKLAKDVVKTAKPAAYFIPARFFTEKDGKQVSYRSLDIAKAIVPKNNGFDKTLAKELFDKAYEANGSKKVVLTVMYADGDDGNKRNAEFLKSCYEEIFGKDKFEFKLQSTPGQVWEDNVNAGKYEITFIGWTSGYDYEPVSKLSPFLSESGMKADSFKSKEFDDLYERCMSGDLVFDEQAKLEAAVKMEKLMLDDASVIPMIEGSSMMMFSDKLILPLKDFVPGVGFGQLQATYTR